MSGESGQLSIHEKLSRIANNLWWSWHPEVVEIFRLIDAETFSASHHNPVYLLEQFSPDELDRRTREAVLQSRIHHAYRRFVAYVESQTTWGATHTAILSQSPVAFFIAEFGLQE
jgi:starch phosphorylase